MEVIEAAKRHNAAKVCLATAEESVANLFPRLVPTEGNPPQRMVLPVLHHDSLENDWTSPVASEVREERQRLLCAGLEKLIDGDEDTAYVKLSGA